MRLAETDDLMMSDCRNCGYITCIISGLQLLNTEPLKLRPLVWQRLKFKLRWIQLKVSVSKVKRKTTQLCIAAFISLSNKMQAHCHYASGPMGLLTVSLYSLTRFCFSDYVCLSFFDLYLFFCTWCMCLRLYTLGLIYCLVSLFTILLFSLNRSSINCFKDFRFSPEDLFCGFFFNLVLISWIYKWHSWLSLLFWH